MRSIDNQLFLMCLVALIAYHQDQIFKWGSPTLNDHIRSISLIQALFTLELGSRDINICSLAKTDYPLLLLVSWTSIKRLIYKMFYSQNKIKDREMDSSISRKPRLSDWVNHALVSEFIEILWNNHNITITPMQSNPFQFSKNPRALFFFRNCQL